MHGPPPKKNIKHYLFFKYIKKMIYTEEFDIAQYDTNHIFFLLAVLKIAFCSLVSLDQINIIFF